MRRRAFLLQLAAVPLALGGGWTPAPAVPVVWTALPGPSPETVAFLERMNAEIAQSWLWCVVAGAPP